MKTVRDRGRELAAALGNLQSESVTFSADLRQPNACPSAYRTAQLADAAIRYADAVRATAKRGARS